MTEEQAGQRAAKRQAQAQDFDPNGLAAPGQVYGLPFDAESAEVVILPVPWEVTVSYASGTARGPEAMREASAQVDLYDPSVDMAWKMGLWMAPSPSKLAAKSERNRERAEAYMEALAEGLPMQRMLKNHEKIEAACRFMIDWVAEQVKIYLDQGQLVALLGGDHSTPLGYIQVLADRNPGMGILQIDAHMDLRKAYEDFTYSHASIMYNAMKHKGIARLVQVGIRDYCEEELEVMQDLGDRISVFFDRDLKQAQFQGSTWAAQVGLIVAALPQKVYLSFDIDGLDPKLCPHTGTPVAGGFEVEQILFLVEQVMASGRQIIGLDLNEVAPGPEGDWDANVGSRLLYRLCNLLGKSNGRI
ncbi:MAG: agmatinase family protein [Schleiferiaceae bacterium]|nr:agmatinase family protein [Schleiferiaceae bacterium]